MEIAMYLLFTYPQYLIKSFPTSNIILAKVYERYLRNILFLNLVGVINIYDYANYNFLVPRVSELSRAQMDRGNYT